MKIARDVFQMTLSSRYPLIDMPSPTPDVEDVLQALEGIQVSVFKRGTTTSVDAIFQRPTGATQGPTPESGATGGPNPFTTGPSGNVEFWVDGPVEVDVFVHDTVGPARISDRTFGWNATAVGPEALPTSMLKKDAGITLGSLAADVKRQLAQIGEVIDWWRPDVAIPVPSGWEICDGHQVAAGQHDFPGLGGSAINVPDLRNRFILGADETKALAAGASQGNLATDAPGIGGSGGSNASKNLGHGHGVPTPSHTHTSYTPDHGHYVGSLYAGDHAHIININTSAPINGQVSRSSGTGTTVNDGHQHNVYGWSGGHNSSAIGGSSGGAGSLPGQATSGPSVALATVTNSLTWTEDPGGGGLIVDVRPRFFGLLKLMKVRFS